MTPSSSVRAKKKQRSSDSGTDALSKVVDSLVTSLEVLQAQNLEQNRLNAEMHAETQRNQHEFQMMMLKMMSSLQPSPMAPPTFMLANRPNANRIYY